MREGVGDLVYLYLGMPFLFAFSEKQVEDSSYLL